MDINIPYLIAGAFGALLPEVIRIGKGPTDGIFKKPGYWIQLAAQVIAGVIAVFFLEPKDGPAAFTLGYSFPQFLTKAASAPTPVQPVGPPAGGGPAAPPVFNARLWWAR